MKQMSLTRKLTVMVVVALLPTAVLAVTQLTSEYGEQMAGRQALVQSQVESQLSILGYYHALEQDGTLTREQAQERGANAVGAVRYRADDYFWIQDENVVMVHHPMKPELNGQDLSGFEDPNGLRLFVEFDETVAADGAGFVDYLWPRPGEDAPVPKVSYVAGFQPWGWIIGTGIYVDDVNAAVTAASIRLGLIALIGLLVAGGVSYVIGRSINGPIRRSASAANTTSTSLAEIASEVSSASQETAAQASVVAAAGEQVSHNVQTVATAVEEMSASVREIASSSADASNVAADAVRTAEHANANVAKLGESSAEIGKVIEVITSIAEQTNLLAHNATIEAARAGEAGKGFAVVANEVKELAGQTAKATEEISTRIAAIQSDTGAAVDAIAEIGGVIARIADMQNTIASAVEEQTATTNEISRNVNEAARGSAEIAENIVSVAGASEQTSQGAVRTQDAAAELRAVADALQAVVDGGGKATAPTVRGGDGATAVPSAALAPFEAERTPVSR